MAAIARHDVLQVSMGRSSNFENCWDFHQFYRAFNANKRQSLYKFQSSVIFSVLFDYRWLHKVLTWETLAWKQSDRDGEEVELFLVLIEIVEAVL